MTLPRFPLRGRTALLALAGVALAASSAYGFIRLTNGGSTGLRFAHQPIRYVIHASGSDDVHDGSVAAAVRMSFDAWAKVPTANIRFTEDTARASGPKVHDNDGVNMVLFDETNATGLFTGAQFVIAITPVFYDGNGAIIDSDVVFNGRDHHFSTTLGAGRYDVQNIGTHEIGHFLGFDHTGVYGASLVPFAYPQDIRMRSLEQDDRAGASAVYPSSAASTLGSLTGSVVRDSTGRGINGAHVVAVNALTGEPEASALTGSGGSFTLELLRPASYHVYAEPLDGPCTDGNIQRNGVETGFWTTFYGGNASPRVTSLGAGQRGVSLGQLRVNELQDGFNIDGSQTRGVLRGTTATFTLTGGNLSSGLQVSVPGSGVRLSEGPNLGLLQPGASFSITVDANATAGLRDIYVYRGSGQFREVVALPGGFEILDPAPRVTSASPNLGASTGGDVVTINGSGFKAGASVLFGDRVVAASSVATAGTSLTVTTPANAVGACPVTVINVDGQQGRLDAAYTYRGIPTILSLAPARGPSAGGVRVTILGQRFAADAQVVFDGRSATQVVVTEGGTRLECTTPRVTSGIAADVAVVNPGAGGGSSTLVDGYTFIDPEVQTIDPAVGSTTGGTVVQIMGDGFAPGARVDFGAGRSPRVDVISQYELRATAPAGAAGTVAITVVNADGRIDSVLGAYRYVAALEPTISLVDPNVGSARGGDTVRIYGTRFDASPAVLFGGVPAQRVTRVSANELTATSPAGSSGAVDVIVRNQDGLQARSFSAYTYEAPASGGSSGGGGGGGSGCSAATGAGSGAGALGAMAPWLTLLLGLAILRRRALALDTDPVLRG